MAIAGKCPFRVLVVDDNQDAADTLALLLTLWGYDCRVSYDGTTALREALHFRPDCLLLDINMPGIDGCTVARRVRQMSELRDSQLVALTACSDPTDVQGIQAAGFNHYFVKPADIDELERLPTMMELTNPTEELAGQNVTLASQTREILQDISEVKDKLGDGTEDVRELKQEIREAEGRPGD